MWFLYALGAIAYLIYLACALPLGLLAGVVVYACGLPGAYLLVLSRVLVTRGSSLPAPPRWPERPPGADPAVLQYFYGPALADARHTVQLAWLLGGQCWRQGRTVIAGTFTADLVPFTAPAGV